MRKIRPVTGRHVGPGNHAHIDLISEFGKDPGGGRADTIAAGFVDARTDPDILGNDPGQLRQFLAFEFGRQIAGKRIAVGGRLDKGRGVPGLQMSADLTSARAIEVADELAAFRSAADRIIEHKGRAHAIALKDQLGLRLTSDRTDAARAAPRLYGPVELRLGVDNHDHHRRLVGRPFDHPPGAWVEHGLQGHRPTGRQHPRRRRRLAWCCRWRQSPINPLCPILGAKLAQRRSFDERQANGAAVAPGGKDFLEPLAAPKSAA